METMGLSSTRSDSSRPIVIVDDDRSFIHLMEQVASRLRIPLRSYKNATEFQVDWSSIREGRPLVLLDINLPDQNGFEILKWIKEKEAVNSLQVIMLTASTRREDILESEKLGAFDYWVKPMTLKECEETLTKAKNSSG